MNQQEEAKGLALEALTTAPPPDLLMEPIDYLFADHFRQRMLCTVLDDIAEAESVDLDLLEAVVRFLGNDLAPHVLDEEEDLFPLLRMRAKPEDEIDRVLGQLSEEHVSDETDAKQIMVILDTIKQGGKRSKMSLEDKVLLKRFAANERQHLIVENAIVLPLARARLTETDKRKLSLNMAARRGIPLSEVAHD